MSNLTSYSSSHICHHVFGACGRHLMSRHHHLYSHNPNETLTVSAPRSRLSILEVQDGGVLPEGSLAQLPTFNYDGLIAAYLGADNPAGHEKTLKWLARYGLVANEVQCPDCQQQLSALIKRSAATDSFAVCLNKILSISFIYDCSGVVTGAGTIRQTQNNPT